MEAQQLGRGFFVKDHHFYKGNENTWNRPSWSCHKTFVFYHKDNLIKNKALKERVDKNIEVAAREKKEREKEVAIRVREETLSRLLQRKIERIVVQNRSNQKLETSVSEVAISCIEKMPPEEASQHALNRSGLRGKFRAGDDNIWNDYNKLTQKSVELLFPASIIKHDEEATNLIASKILQEKKRKLQEELLAKTKKDNIYQYEKELRLKNTARHSHYASQSRFHPSQNSDCSLPNTVNNTGTDYRPHTQQSEEGPFSRFENTHYTGQPLIINYAESDKHQISAFASEHAPSSQLPKVPYLNTDPSKQTQSITDMPPIVSTAGSQVVPPQAPGHTNSSAFQDPKLLTVNTDEHSDFLGLHIPRFNKDTASINIPYTRFILGKSNLARNRVNTDFSQAEGVDKHLKIRENKKIVSHLPRVKTVARIRHPEQNYDEEFCDRRVGFGVI